MVGREAGRNIQQLEYLNRSLLEAESEVERLRRQVLTLTRENFQLNIQQAQQPAFDMGEFLAMVAARCGAAEAPVVEENSVRGHECGLCAAYHDRSVS